MLDVITTCLMYVFTILYIYINIVVDNKIMLYNFNMAKLNGKILNKYDIKLQEDLEALMKEHEVKFPVFLPILRDDLPEDKSSNEYKLKHKAEYLKYLRASFSVEEIKKMLDVLGYKLVFTLNDNKIEPKKYFIDDVKIKYTELMAVCELLGIDINWTKQ